MPDCEQCKKAPATRIWSDDGHFPGVYLCAKCNGQVSKATAKLAASRRPRGAANAPEITQGKSPKVARPVPKPQIVAPRPSSQNGPLTHRPGQNWQGTSCLCSCHVEKAVGCDNKDCNLWRIQLAKPVNLPALENMTW